VRYGTPSKKWGTGTPHIIYLYQQLLQLLINCGDKWAYSQYVLHMLPIQWLFWCRVVTISHRLFLHYFFIVNTIPQPKSHVLLSPSVSGEFLGQSEQLICMPGPQTNVGLMRMAAVSPVGSLVRGSAAKPDPIKFLCVYKLYSFKQPIQ